MKKSSIFTGKFLTKLNAKGIQLLTNTVLILICGFFVYVFFIAKEGTWDFNLFGRIAVILFFVSVSLNLLASKILSTSLNMIIHNAQKLSDGQLNIADIKISESTNYKVLARALNQMKSNLLTFIEQTKNNVITLNESIDQVSSSMKKTSKGNEQISATITGVSDKSQEQLRLARVTVEKMEEANEKIDSITLHIHDVQEFSAGTHVTTTNGIEKIGEYNENIQVIFTNLNYTSEYISKLRDDIEQIETISNFIENISNKLKLLAMNASIEAARSGEAGKGFAVVSQEITKLSEATKEGIGRVQNMVISILDNSGSVVSSVDNIKNDFETGINIFDGVKVIFHDIQEKSSSILNEINEVGAEIGKINEITKQTSVMSQEVFDFSIGVSDGTKEISAVINDETSELIGITDSTNSLLSMLGKIEGLTNKFDLDIKPINKQPKSKMKIAIVSPYNHPFWYPVKKGAIYAKQTLKKYNTEVDFIGIEDINVDTYTKAVKEAINVGYDGIAISGMYKELIPLIESANEKHIPIITFNSDFETESKRIAFVGQNAYEAGVVSAEAMLEAIGHRGNVVVVTSDFSITSHELRRKGFNDRIAKAKKVKIVKVIEAHEQESLTRELLAEYYKENTNIDGIYLTVGGQLAAVQFLKEAGLDGKTEFIVHDFMEEILEQIKLGVITCAIGQDPFRQGYEPAIYLYNYVVGGIKPETENLWTRLDVVTKDNVDDLLS